MPRTLPEMVPDSPSRARQRRAGLITAVLISSGIAVRSEFFGSAKPDAMSYVAVAFIFVANIGVVVFGWRAHDGFLVRPNRRGRPGQLVRPSRLLRRGGLARRGRDGAAYGTSPAAGAGRVPATPDRWETTADCWPALRAASRLMPGPAGRRWLAEAVSLLSELDAGRRRAAERSYLRSAPRLVLMMWIAELSRRARRRLR